MLYLVTQDVFSDIQVLDTHTKYKERQLPPVWLSCGPPPPSSKFCVPLYLACACVIFPGIHLAGFCVPPPSFAIPSHICALNALPGCVTNMPPSTFKNAFISSLYSYILDLNVSVLYIIRVPLFSYNFMLFCIHKLS